MQFYISSGSGYRDHYYGFNAEFTGFMIITFGTFISLFLIVIMILVWCICCRVKKPSNRVFVHPMDQLHRGNIFYLLLLKNNLSKLKFVFMSPLPLLQGIRKCILLLSCSSVRLSICHTLFSFNNLNSI